ncbi:hypothetical protein FQN57_004609 [Myotisia sp. PD_48]|nr:hypothetical protein FQN57_004609 [Myotisia sp. PD_48]
MAQKQASLGRRTNTRPRARKRTVTADSGSEQSIAGSVPDATADILRRLKHSVQTKKTTHNDGRQTLQAHHRNSVKKIEDRLQETSRTSIMARVEYRKAQMEKLSELVTKKLELENGLATKLQSLETTYQAASNIVKENLAKTIATLR